MPRSSQESGLTCDRQLLPPGENHRIIAPAKDYSQTQTIKVPFLRNCFAYLILGSLGVLALGLIGCRAVRRLASLQSAPS